MPTKEEIAEETAFHNRLIEALLEPLTSGSISTSDLAKWNYRAAVMQDIEVHLDRIVGASDEKPLLARFILCLTIWKALQRLLEPTVAAPKPKTVGGVEALVRSRQTVKPGPKRKKLSKKAEWLRAKVATMTDEEREAYRAKERARAKERRERLKAETK
jgi:hypothetical protein